MPISSSISQKQDTREKHNIMKLHEGVNASLALIELNENKIRDKL